MTVPARMTAIAIREPGKPEVLVPQERDTPTPKQGEVLVKVAAAGVNRPDVMQREGKYPPPPVTALVAGGGYAEYAAVHETNALPVIPQLSMVEAGAIPETFFTVWHNVFERGALKAGETMLIHGGSSGIGTTAIMLAKAHGARVIVTVGSEEKAEACRKLGADVAINYNTQDFVAETKKATNNKGAELIVDMVAGEYIQKNYEAAAMDGRIVQIAFQRPPKFLVDFRPLLVKRLWHTGSGLRPRPVEQKAAIARAVEDNVWPLIASGKVKPVIYKTFPLREAAAAHALMETSQHIGKIVLTN
jgi:NADPH:quinone reductase